MRLEVSPIKKSCLRERIFPSLPILVLSFLLNLILILGAPSAKAQVSSLEISEGEISGTVLREADKRPASQVAVSLKSRVAGIFRSVLTDFEGRFKVQNLPRGTYDVAVDEEGYEAAQTSAQLDGPSAKLVVYLRSKSVPTRQNSYTVSVRELKIPGKAQDELRKGLELGTKKDLAGSLVHFRKAAQAYPDYFEAYYNIGVAEMAMGRRDEAMQAFQTSIDLSGGKYALPQFGYGYLLCQTGRPAEAEKIIRKGLEADDAAPQGYVILGEALKLLNRLDEAEKSEREALLRNPNTAGAYLVLSDVAESKGDFHAQIEDLDTYLKLQPNGPGSELARKVREGVQKILAKSQPQDGSSSQQP
jgi:tetratricopeptide (TPR) repeat protein